MILIWGVPGDKPLASVREALEQMGAPVFFLNQHDVLRSAIDMSVNSAVEGVLRTPEGEVKLENITAAYVRPYESARLPELAGTTPTLASHAEAFDDVMLGWTEVTAARVVNRPSAMASNQSKPHQLALIHEQGFLVPETLVTTDAAALETFRERHGDLIFKSISGVRSIVTRFTPEHGKRITALAHSPVQFQKWVDGIDVRVHVAGDELFACKVRSSAVDYRYPRGEEEYPEITPCDLPGDVAERCRGLAASLGLLVAGIDLRRTAADEWYCLEVNPSPAFTFYAEATGLEIGLAVARVLSN